MARLHALHVTCLPRQATHCARLGRFARLARSVLSRSLRGHSVRGRAGGGFAGPLDAILTILNRFHSFLREKILQQGAGGLEVLGGCFGGMLGALGG